MKEPYEVWNALLEKPVAERSRVEQVIVDVNCLLIDIENGGWLYNISPAAGEGKEWTQLRAVIESVREVGATEMARTLSQIAEIVSSADVQEPGTNEGFIQRADPGKRLPALKESISDQSGDAWQFLEDYTARHFPVTP